MDKKPDSPPLWWTITKLVVIAMVLMGGVGYVLVWVDEHQSKDVSPAVKPSDPWGIARDSPINFRR